MGPADQSPEVDRVAGVGVGHAIASAHWIVLLGAGVVGVDERRQHAGVPKAGAVVHGRLRVEVDRIGVGAPLHVDLHLEFIADAVPIDVVQAVAVTVESIQWVGARAVVLGGIRVEVARGVHGAAENRSSRAAGAIGPGLDAVDVESITLVGVGVAITAAHRVVLLGARVGWIGRPVADFIVLAGAIVHRGTWIVVQGRRVRAAGNAPARWKVQAPLDVTAFEQVPGGALLVEQEVDAEWAGGQGVRMEGEGDDAGGQGTDGEPGDPLDDGTGHARVGHLNLPEGVSRVVGETGFDGHSSVVETVCTEEHRRGTVRAARRKLDAMLFVAAGHGGTIGRVFGVGRQEEAGLGSLSVSGQGHIEIPAFSGHQRREADVEDGLVDLHAGRQGGRQGEIPDVKRGGAAVAEDESVAPHPFVHTLDAVVHDGDAGAVRGHGVPGAFVDQFIGTVFSVGSGPLPADDVFDGFGEAEQDGIVKGAVRCPSRILEVGKVRVDGADHKVRRGQDDGRLAVGVDEQLVHRATAVVVKGQRNAAVFPVVDRSQGGRDVTGTVDQGEVEVA